MRFSSILCAISLSALLLICAPAQAGDRVTLSSGVVIDGLIVMERPTVVVLELPGLGSIRIPREDIASIEKDVTERKGSRVQRARNPEGEKRDSSLLRYDDLSVGSEILLILTGEEHELWRTSGQRHYCRVDMVGPRRMKVSTSSKAGALGEIWVPRDSVDRIVDIGTNPDFRIMLFDGAQTGAWVRVTTEDGSLVAGRLEGVSEEGTVRILVPLGSEMREVAVDLGDLRSLQTIVRKADLIQELTTLDEGEPVVLHVWGHPDPVSGTYVGREADTLLVESAPAADGTTEMQRVFMDLPIIKVDRLPAESRRMFSGKTRGATITVHTTTEDARGTVHRAATGQLVSVSFDAVTLDTGAERKSIPHQSVTSVDVPEKSRVAALRGELDLAGMDRLPAVLPGMTEEEVQRAIPKAHPGLDVSFVDGKVEKVTCRAPWHGSPFGLPIGGSLTTASATTALVFDTQIDPKEAGFTTVESHSVKGLLVTLYVSEDSKILGMEITAR